MSGNLRISIVNHSNPDMLHDCLVSIYANTRRPFEIWVVDNATDQRRVPEIQAEFPEVKWIFNSRRLGFSTNHNQVLSTAQGGYSIILNDDTIIHPGAFDVLAEYLDTHPRVGMAGPRLLNPDGSIQNSTFRFMSLFSELMDISILPGALARLKSMVIDPAQWGEKDVKVDWVLGACIAIRHETLMDVGLLDANLSPIANTEETDWCYRAHQKGWDVAFVPSSQITHIGGQSMKSESPQSRTADKFRVEMYRTRLAFFRKHYGVWRTLLLRGLYAVTLPFNLFMLWQGVQRKRITPAYGAAYATTLRGIARLSFRPIGKPQLPSNPA